MPPKVKITKADILETALQILREGGDSTINARGIAKALSCSTQPVFSNFATMEELYKAITESAFELYLSFLKREMESEKYPKYKAFGMAYIRFAREESELFKFLFMCDRKNKEFVPTTDFDESVEMIMRANNISKERATLMHFEMWSCVHGIGTMIATSFLDLEDEFISNMLTDVYQGIRARHISEENNNGCN